METFDVVIVGAGPAGGQCARQLAAAGISTLLIERYKDFSVNSFSSAGTPNETLTKYNLPESVVGSFWNQLKIVTSNQSGVWTSATTQGSVLDFEKLRSFLAGSAQTSGAQVWMSCIYISHEIVDGKTIVNLRRDRTDISVETRILVDATGPNRSVISDCHTTKQPDLITGTGVEFLIEVDEESYYHHARSLTFFLGYKWMPKGYSWIFPMDRHRLKVGAGIVNLDHEYIREMQPLKHYIQLIIDDYIKPKSYQIVERHGGTVRYSLGLKDIYIKDNVIAIGDAVSTINFLGGEGIRHGMHSADVATHYIKDALAAENITFTGYQQEMHQIFLKDWKISEKLGLKKYLADSDQLVDKVVNYLKPLKLEDVVDILFYYKFEKASKGLGAYLRRKILTGFSKLKMFAKK
jgi:digeranylgeranylglycerophospholipid reductase